MKHSKLISWIQENNLDVINSGNIYFIGEESFYYLREKEGKIFDEDFNFILDKEDLTVLEEGEVDNWLFEFGDTFYYHSLSKYFEEFQVFRYLGKLKKKINIPYVHLGVHAYFDLMEGVGLYEDYCKKARFFGSDSLGICERNLGGVLKFIRECKNYDLKPVIGQTLKFAPSSDLNHQYDIKLYVKNYEGWKNLLRIKNELNLSDLDHITEEHLENYSEGLIVVFSNECISFLNKVYLKHFITIINDQIYFQIDSVRWADKRDDLAYLKNIKKYLESEISSGSDALEPVLINDSYYLDKEDYKLKKIIHQIDKSGYVKISKDQHFKNIDEVCEIFFKLWLKEDEAIEFIKRINDNAIQLADDCNLKFPDIPFHLPSFDLEKLQERTNGYKKYKDNAHLFRSLIFLGLAEMGKTENKEYLERIDREVAVIEKGGFVDYFLILWDILRESRERNIFYGMGRGSAAGSLVAYCLKITYINPFDYELLFERFMNEGRIKSLPDIDIDFESKRRNEIREYVEELYGREQVVAVGSYLTLQIKQGIKDLSRILGIDYSYTNYITTTLRLNERRTGNWDELFRVAQVNDKLKEFIFKYPHLINLLRLILNHPKAVSVHPCAIIIIPKEEGNLFEWIPVRKEEGGALITEWEGSDLEEEGFLKEDLLGLKDLDKIRLILNLIEEQLGEKIDIYKDISTKDDKVFKFFKDGWNSDVFQFHTSGLTSLSKKIKPESIDDLIAMVALYRPGPLGSGADKDYVAYKNKVKEPVYDFGLQEVTEITYGLYIYQEQVMQACMTLGGFPLPETDDIRRAMGKKKLHVLKPYKDRFVKGAISKGCSKEEAIKIWDKLELFAGYGFNKSHAAAYATMGYISQWLKCHYPIQFWTAAFQHVKEASTDVPRFIYEISQIHPFIEIVPPDINKSSETFGSDYTQNKIYWSLSGIKFLGPVSIEFILVERETNGKFYSIEDFYKRIVIEGGKVDRRGITNLILGGAFDEIQNIESPRERGKLIEQYIQYVELEESEKKYLEYEDWWYTLKQKELTNIGKFNYIHLLNKSKIGGVYCEDLQRELPDKEKIRAFGGIVKEIKQRNSKNGPWLQIFLDSNDDDIVLYAWNQEYIQNRDLLESGKGNILLFNGVIREDPYFGKNVVHLKDVSKVDLLVAYKLEIVAKKINISFKKGDIVLLKDGFEGLITRYYSNKEITVEKGNEKRITSKDQIEKIL